VCFPVRAAAPLVSLYATYCVYSFEGKWSVGAVTLSNCRSLSLSFLVKLVGRSYSDLGRQMREYYSSSTTKSADTPIRGNKIP